MSKVLFSCTIPGRCYIKKNQQIMMPRGRFVRVAYTKKYLAWEADAKKSVLKKLADLPNFKTIQDEINMKAVFYFEDMTGQVDLSNAYEGIQDVLQKIGVIENDTLISGHDGSDKFFYDPNPRVEIELTFKRPARICKTSIKKQESKIRGDARRAQAKARKESGAVLFKSKSKTILRYANELKIESRPSAFDARAIQKITKKEG